MGKPTYKDLEERIRTLEQAVADAQRIQTALRESEEKFRILADSTPTAVLLYQDDRWIYVNRAAQMITGYTETEFLGMNFWDLAHPRFRAQMKRQGRKRLAGDETTRRYEFKIVTKGGLDRWVDMVAASTTVGGRPAGIVSISDVTKRKRAQEAFREESIRRRILFDQSPDGILIIDPGTARFLDFNTAAHRQLGYTREEFAGLAIFDVEAEETPEETRERIKAVLESGKADFDVIQRTKTGELRNIHVTAQSMDVEGKHVYHCIWRDITDRKRMEEALRESEEKYRLVVENMREGVVIAQDGVLKFVNQAACDMAQYPREEMALQPFIEFFHPDERAKLAEYHARRLRGEDLPPINAFRAVARDGAVKWVELNTARISWEGRPATLTIFTDITERRQAEEALRESENWYRAIFSNTGAATVILEEDTTIALANPEFERLSGYSREELEGEKSWTEFTVKADLDVMLERHKRRRLDKNAAPGRYEFQLRNRRGEIRDIILTVDMIPGTSRSVASLLDITEQREAEKESRRLESQLQQAQKMESIGTLAGGIAHDFNNILASVMGFAELSMKDIKDEKQRGYLSQVLRASERAKNLVGQILTFSRQRAQERRPIDVRSMVKEALKLLRSTIPSTIRIKDSISSEAAVVSADPTQIHQIVMNLCTNAAHAMGDRGGILEVSLARIDIVPELVRLHPDLTTGPYVLLTVSDTGHGIDPAILEKIFDPFFTTKGPERGTGLGLSVVYGIVRSYGGVISVESSVGAGSRFSVYLPRIEARGAVEEKKTTDELKGGHEKILFVDDEEALANLVPIFLRSLDYEVVSTTSSIEALDIFRRDPLRFDLVVTDMTMPDMTGLELAQRLLAIRKDLPVILCTGYHESITAQEVKRQGIRKLVMKPVSLKDLAMLIRKTLHG